MAEDEVSPKWPVRISLIGGNHYVFDAEAISLLRREANIAGNLTGTLPQQPNQNIFLGPPLRLRPEEVEVLVEKKLAYVVDAAAAALHALTSRRDHTAYHESLRAKRNEAQRVMSDVHAQRRTEMAQKLSGMTPDRAAVIQKRAQKRAETERSTGNPSATESNSVTADAAQENNDNAEDEEILFENKNSGQDQSKRQKKPEAAAYGFAVTPSTSKHLVTAEDDAKFIVAGEAPSTSHHTVVPNDDDSKSAVASKPFALARHFQENGMYTTPGLRFGAQYSVYPGDPLRYHAHFMANEYGWNEEIPVSEINQGGRLATAVKKAFVIGGEEPDSDGKVHTFSIEWAGM